MVAERTTTRHQAEPHGGDGPRFDISPGTGVIQPGPPPLLHWSCRWRGLCKRSVHDWNERLTKGDEREQIAHRAGSCRPARGMHRSGHRGKRSANWLRRELGCRVIRKRDGKRVRRLRRGLRADRRDGPHRVLGARRPGGRGRGNGRGLRVRRGLDRRRPGGALASTSIRTRLRSSSERPATIRRWPTRRSARSSPLPDLLARDGRGRYGNVGEPAARERPARTSGRSWRLPLPVRKPPAHDLHSGSPTGRPLPTGEQRASHSGEIE